MTLEGVLWIVAGCLWGYLAGRLIAAGFDALDRSGSPMRVPLITPTFNAMARGVEWYVRHVQALVMTMSAGLERLLHVGR